MKRIDEIIQQLEGLKDLESEALAYKRLLLLVLSDGVGHHRVEIERVLENYR